MLPYNRFKNEIDKATGGDDLDGILEKVTRSKHVTTGERKMLRDEITLLKKGKREKLIDRCLDHCRHEDETAIDPDCRPEQ